MQYLRPLTPCTLMTQRLRVFERDTERYAGKLEFTGDKALEGREALSSVIQLVQFVFRTMPSLQPRTMVPGKVRFFTREWATLELEAIGAISRTAALEILAEEDAAYAIYCSPPALRPPKPEPTYPTRPLPPTVLRRFHYWSDRVPPELAEIQARWEQREEVIRMRALGMTFQAIGDHYGIHRERVRQLEAKQLRMRKHPRFRSPVERYFAECPFR